MKCWSFFLLFEIGKLLQKMSKRFVVIEKELDNELVLREQRFQVAVKEHIVVDYSALASDRVRDFGYTTEISESRFSVLLFRGEQCSAEGASAEICKTRMMLMESSIGLNAVKFVALSVEVRADYRQRRTASVASV
jgi:hypothetical protein